MSQAEARAWWADVEHLRAAAERRQAADAEQRAREQRAAERRERADAETFRARNRAVERVRDASHGSVDELSARRAVLADERAPRARRPAPIWLAEDAFAEDPVALARARAAAPRRTIEIRGQVAMPAEPRTLQRSDIQRAPAPMVRRERATGLAASFASRPDRLAFWAFAMGLTLALVAAMTGGHA
jgi:hypothetical protein